jgi:hypothetical protein
MNRSLALALLALAGCAAARAEQGRQQELRRQLDARALPAPLEQAWPAALRVLAEAGYPLVGKDREAAGQPAQSVALDLFSRGFSTRVVGKDARAAATGMGPDRTRFQIAGAPAPGGSRVVFTKIYENPTEPSERREERDMDMELALWRKVDPQGAAALAGGAATAIATATATPTPSPSPSPKMAAAAESATFDPWAPVRHLLGRWEGEGQGRTGVSKVSWTCELVLRGRYLQLRGTSVFEPQPANPTGEQHEEVSLFSWDKRRTALVWRQFNVEGFVNQFVLEKEEGDELTFVTEAIEGLPPGFRAREVLRRVGPDELHTRFSIAAPGKDFEPYAENRLRRVK